MVQRDRKKERERERKRRKNRKYGQAKLKHAKRGIISCVLSGIILITMVSMLAKAYFSKGDASPFIGALGLSAAIFSGVGLYMGIRGFRERDKDYLTCKIGIGCCAFFILGFIFIFLRGLF